jgi:GTP-dependent phosphoenolpyruvate carboxykinase
MLRLLGLLLSCLWVSSSVISSVAVAQEAPAKKDARSPETAMVNQFLKQFEKAELPAETTEKIKAMFSQTAKEVMAKRKEVGLTPQMLKLRTEAGNKAREEGKKPKEVRELALAAMNATEDQKRVLLDTEDRIAKTKIEIGKLLTDAQKEKLPKQLQNNLKEPKNAKK